MQTRRRPAQVERTVDKTQDGQQTGSECCATSEPRLAARLQAMVMRQGGKISNRSRPMARPRPCTAAHQPQLLLALPSDQRERKRERGRIRGAKRRKEAQRGACSSSPSPRPPSSSLSLSSSSLSSSSSSSLVAGMAPPPPPTEAVIKRAHLFTAYAQCAPLSPDAVWTAPRSARLLAAPSSLSACLALLGRRLARTQGSATPRVPIPSPYHAAVGARDQGGDVDVTAAAISMLDAVCLFLFFPSVA